MANALYRARLAFFVDAFFSKAMPLIFAGQRAQSEADKDAAAEDLVAVVVKELEPLFNWDNSSPFFGGSDRLTLAEVSLTFYSAHSLIFQLVGGHCSVMNVSASLFQHFHFHFPAARLSSFRSFV